MKSQTVCSVSAIFCAITATAQSIEIPVIPRKELYQPSQPHLPSTHASPEQRSKEKFESVTAPDEAPLTEERINLSNAQLPSSAPDIAKKIPGATVQTHGSSGGEATVRFQGAPVHEPHYFINGLSLQGSQNGSQNLVLIPSIILKNVKAWPDLSPYWLPENGLGGAMEFSTHGNINATSPQHRALIRMGSFNFLQLGALAGSKFGVSSNIDTGIEYSSSKENYPVLNNGNTPFNPVDDRTENRANNDFSRIGAGISVSSAAHKNFGVLHTYFLGGREERGLPGAVETPTDARLRRLLLLGGISADKLFLESGVQQRWYIGQTHDTATVTSKQSNSEAISSQWSTFAGYNLAIPNWILAGSTGIAINTQYTSLSGESRRINVQNEEAAQTLVHFSVSRSLVFENPNSLAWSIDGSIRGSLAQATANRTCAAETIATDCGTLLHSQSPILGSGHLGAQLQLPYNSSAFLRAASATRRPFLQETMGSVSGVIPNAALKSETSKKLTLGVALPFTVASCYRAYDTNLIFFQQVDAQRVRASNLDKVTRTGCNQQLSYKLWDTFTPSASYSWVRASVESPSYVEAKELPRTPEHTVQLSFLLDNLLIQNSNSPWRVTPFTEWIWRSPMYLDGANFVELNLPPQWNSTLSLYKIPSDNRYGKLAYTLELENILDDRSGTRRDSAGHAYMVEHVGYSGFPPPGRRLFFRIEWQM